MDDILMEVWEYIGGKIAPPVMEFRRQHCAGLYWRKHHKISIREDSWRNMPLAEQRLLICHEALHAAGIRHGAGMRTSNGILPMLVYDAVWGKDEPLHEYVSRAAKKLDLAKRRNEKGFLIQ